MKRNLSIPIALFIIGLINAQTTGIEYLYFNDDGTIKPITPTREGVKPVDTKK